MGKKKKKGIRNDYLVLKNKLSNIYNSEEIQEKLLNICKRTNTIVRHTLMFIRTYFCYLYSNNLHFPMIDDIFVRNIYCCVSTVSKNEANIDKDVINFNQEHFSLLGLKYESRNNLTQLLTYETTQIITHIENNIVEHFIQHFNKYIKIMFRYDEKVKGLSKEETVKLKKTFYSIKSYILGLNDSIDEYEEFATTIKTKLFPFPIEKSVHYDIKVEPQKYLYSLFVMNDTFEKINTRNITYSCHNNTFMDMNKTIVKMNKFRKQYNINVPSIKKQQMFKTIGLFNVTPMRLSLIVPNVTLDSMAIVQIFGKEIKEKIDSGHFTDINLTNVEKVRRNFNNSVTKHELWSVLFNMEDKFFKKKGNYIFEYQLKTDAFSFSGTFVHKDAERTKTGRVKSFCSQRKEDSVTYIEELDTIPDKEIVCIDPNKRDIAFCGKYEGNELKTFRYTMCQRRKDMKHKKYNVYRWKLEHELKDVISEKAKYNMRSVNFINICNNIMHVEEINETLLEHYTNELYRKLKWFSFLNKKKSESKMTRTFKQKMGSNEDTIVIIGDYSCKGSNLKGTVPVPSMKIIKMFQRAQYDTYLINEYNTSKLCHYCNDELEPFIWRKSPKPNTDSVNLVHGLLRHTTEGHPCQIICNRDKNAVSNMLKIIDHITENKVRPPIFCYRCNE